MAEHPAGTVANPALTGLVHRSQACTKVGAGDPVHVPTFNDQVDPTVSDPATEGSTVLAGADIAEAATATVLIAPASAKPEEFVPAT